VVQRADASDQAVVLKVREPGRTTFVLALGNQGVGLSEARVARPGGSRPVARLEGFRVAWVSARAVGLVRSDPDAGEQRARLEARRDGRVEVLVGPAVWSEADAVDAAPAAERQAWLARGESLAEGHATSALEARRVEARRALKQALARIARRVEAVRGDMARIGDAEALASRAQWLVAEASRAPRGAKSLSVVDWSSGEAVTIEVPLDPAKPARAQVEAMFQRARRLKTGAKVAAARLAEAEQAREQLGPLDEVVAGAADAKAIDDAMARAKAIAPKDVKLAAPGSGSAKAATSKGATKAPPFRTFHARSGARVLVGRGAAHNDVLTFQVAKPHDLWLHAKGWAGAHVIVPLVKNHSCPGDVLADAAHLAAHFSDARDEAVVEVQYAARRYVRKPRGSAPGLVVVEREKVIAVRIDAAVMRALLESEES
jgi:predicted ribosome quality control (RQC) complex YloA/Tae2 family protein